MKRYKINSLYDLYFSTKQKDSARPPFQYQKPISKPENQQALSASKIESHRVMISLGIKETFLSWLGKLPLKAPCQ